MKVNISFCLFEADPVKDHDTDEPKPLKAVVCLDVSKEDWGFGTFTIKQTPEGVFVDTECSGKEMVKEAFIKLIDSAITDYDTDPVNHAKWSAAFNRSCNSKCQACAIGETMNLT